MKIYSVVFDYPGKTDYQQLAAVFQKSVEVNCPGTELTIEHIDAPRETKKNHGMTSNYLKFQYWEAFINAQRDGEHVILMDADMVVLHDLRPAFREDFDIGATHRTSVAWPYNGGVVFIKINDRTRAFVHKWGEIDHAMYEDDALHDPYRHKYKGQNQASFGYMLEHHSDDVKILDFPCAVWNACNEDWMYVNDDTRVIHIKSGLRRALLGYVPGVPSKRKRAYFEWKKYETMLEEEG